MESSSTTLWLFCDGKRGHENQVLGLAEALCRQKPFRLETVRLPHDDSFRSRRAALRAAMEALPAPALVLGAGHSTHLPLIYAAKRTGAKSVVLMRPSLPEFLFDCCVIPEHDLGDGAADTRRRLITRGAINRMRYDPGRKENRGVLLIGGPSREHGWDGDRLLAELTAVVEAEAETRWVLTTSRRTPRGFLDALRESLPGVACFEGAETGPDWLPDQLARAGEVWVTGDSVSMIYEGLTAGARVGVLTSPLRAKPSKLTQGVERLARDGYITRWERWRETGKLSPPPGILAEADRCAGALMRRLGWA